MEFTIKGFLGPGDKASPMVLELLPDDLDQIQFRTVRRQMDKECAVVNEPTIQSVLGDIVMDTCIIQNDQRRTCIPLADDAIEKVDHSLAVDRTGVDLGVQPLRPKIQSPEHGACAVLGRFGGMRLATRRPGALYRRRGTETGLVKIDQPDNPLGGRLTRQRQCVLSGEEFVFGALFLSEKRVLLDDRPRAIKPLRKVPNEQGRGA